MFSDSWRVRIQRPGLLPPDVTDSDEALSDRRRLAELHGEADRPEVRILHSHPEGTPQAGAHSRLVHERRVPHRNWEVRTCSDSTLRPAYNEFGYNEHPPTKNIFLSIKINDNSVKKFGYYEHAPTASSFLCTSVPVPSLKWELVVHCTRIMVSSH